jgi:diketogulonate reductase-like aldo/keto reductase
MKSEDLYTGLLNRREFNGICTTLGPSLLAVGALALSGASPLHATINSARAAQRVKFRDGTTVPAIGQGSWHLGDNKRPPVSEEEALRTGLSQGMTLIDTALVYAAGRSEELVGRAIAGQRDRVFLVSKVPPDRRTEDDIALACETSLARLGTDHLDLYLLHWRGDADLPVTVTSFENLRSAGKIRAWGVSNFGVKDMEELFRIPRGDRCATNQVLYNVGKRDLERDLLPWCQQRNMPVMAYSPLGGPGASLLRDPTLTRIGLAHGCSTAAVALAWTIRSGNVIAIPESGSAAHVKENAVALSLTLTPEDLRTLDAAHPPPG